MTDKPLDVMVIVPSMGTWEADFGASLVALFANFWATEWPYKNRDLKLHSTMGSLLANNRLNSLKRAVEVGCTHALFIDADQTFPQHTLRKLLSWGLPVVACNVATKQIPASPTARNKAGNPVFTTPFDKDLEQVWRVGTGVMLIELSAVKDIAQPWFGSRWEESQCKNVGEDWYFNEVLEAAGVKIFIDHTLSLEIGHIGRYTYTHFDVPTPREVLNEKNMGDLLSPDNHVVLNGSPNIKAGQVHPTRRVGLRSSADSVERRRRSFNG